MLRGYCIARGAAMSANGIYQVETSLTRIRIKMRSSVTFYIVSQNVSRGVGAADLRNTFSKIFSERVKKS